MFATWVVNDICVVFVIEMVPKLLIKKNHKAPNTVSAR